MAGGNDSVTSKVLLKDVLGQKFLVQKNKVTGKTEQVITPSHFRVGINPCDAALTVTGPVFSLCGSATSVLSGNLIICGSITAGSGLGGGGGGSGDPNASYVVIGLTGSLNNERVLTAGTGISLVDGGANSTITINNAGGVDAPTDAQYLTLALDGGLSQERVFTPGTGLAATDGGANGNYTLGIVDSVVATISGSTFKGATLHNLVMSGSLTRLVDGSSYLIEGDDISITSASNGSVTISAPNMPPIVPVYQGYAEGSYSWTASTWTNISTVVSAMTDAISAGITRSGGTFTFISGGYYMCDARFNAFSTDNYLGFRLQSSAPPTTYLQHTDYVNHLGQHVSSLSGIFQVTAGAQIDIEYAQKSGSVSTWQTFGTLDSQNMRTVNISFYGIRLVEPS